MAEKINVAEITLPGKEITTPFSRVRVGVLDDGGERYTVLLVSEPYGETAGMGLEPKELERPCSSLAEAHAMFKTALQVALEGIQRTISRTYPEGTEIPVTVQDIRAVRQPV